MADAPFAGSPHHVGEAYPTPGLSLFPRPLLWKAVLILGVPLLLVLLLAIHPWTFGSGDSGYQFIGQNAPNPDYQGGYQVPNQTFDTGGQTVVETTTESVETTTAGDPDTEAAAVTAILNQAKNDRGAVVAAVGAASRCDNLSSDLTAMQGAQNDRQNLAQQAAGLAVDALSGASSVPSLLNAALKDSATADGDFVSWIQDLQQSCTAGNATSDMNYSAAGEASTTAETDKQTLLNTWNPVAQAYSQPTFATSDI